MRNRPLLITSIVSVFGMAAIASWPPSSPAQTPTTADCKAYGTNTPLSTELLVPGMLPPCAPAVTSAGPFADIVDNLQHGFDLYSWLTFVALNSPADGTTPIGKGPRPGGDAPAVWESYKQLPDVTLEGGREPSKWGEPVDIPPECGGGVVKPGTTSYTAGKVKRTLLRPLIFRGAPTGRPHLRLLARS